MVGRNSYVMNVIIKYTSSGTHETCTMDDFACHAMAQVIDQDQKLSNYCISNWMTIKMVTSICLNQTMYAHTTFRDCNKLFCCILQFLKEELKLDSGYEKRQKNFHKNDDMHISVKELLEAWLRSEVHNWTIEQTSDWLMTCVELPQYVPNFVQHKVTGANLPR